ncbi:hypothetical protein MC885_003080 [Smutsia gigantea]|nr:hypothetical protein MC885_003080 [Smutsia gigantea]
MSLLARRHRRCAGRGQCAPGPRAQSLRIACARSWGVGGAWAASTGNTGRHPSSPGPLPAPPPHVRWGGCLVRRRRPRPRQTVGYRACGGISRLTTRTWGRTTGSSPAPPPPPPFRIPRRDLFWGSL